MVPQVHDLVRLRSQSAFLPAQSPSARLPVMGQGPFWAVVRRGLAGGQLVPIGVRGAQRHERWAGYARMSDVLAIHRPEELRLHLAQDRRRSLPAFQSLQFIERGLAGADLNWGPGGSVGYELASGVPAVRDSSDLDLVIFATEELSRVQMLGLWQMCSSGPGRIDVLVETPFCGFSLEEYATTTTKMLLLRTAQGHVLGLDPWGMSDKCSEKAEVS